MSIPENFEERVNHFRQRYQAWQEEIHKVMVGHHDIVDQVLLSMVAGGHVLLEGVPGLGKTLLVRTLATTLTLPFQRIQFTPDLMPADIIGTNVIATTEAGGRELRFQPGPIFAQLVLADEINRATPKTQSALLEAMQEHSITVAGQVHRLQEPFFVLATQNPVEQEGTYPLPEAQLDRFFFKLVVPYATRADLHEILNRTTANLHPSANPVMDADQLRDDQRLVRDVLVASHVQDYAIRLVLATHPGGEFAPKTVTKYVRLGSSPRGAQTILLAARARALVAGRPNVSFDDVRSVVVPALRHRLMMNFEAQADEMSPEQILQDVVAFQPEQHGSSA